MFARIIILPAYLILTASMMHYGCNSSSYKKETIVDSTAAKTCDNLFPASAGNKWEYINEGPRDESEIYKVEINDIKTDNDDKIAELSSFPFFSKTEEKTSLRFKPNGEVYLINKTSGKEELLIPEASKIKKEYKWQFGEWTGIVGSVNENVKAETGTYNNCIYLNFSIYYTFSAEIWLAKDTGIVKWGYFRTNPPTLKPTYYVLNKLSLAK